MPITLTKNWKNIGKHLDDLPQSIIDVGVGQGTPCLYEAFPDAYYLFIEPLSEYQETINKLLETYSGEYAQVALGARAEQNIIHVDPKRLQLSSLCQRTPLTATPGILEKRQISVETLDQLIKSRNIPKPFGIRINTQGFELEVLKGAIASLCHTSFILVDISIAARFENSYTFSEFITFLESRDFQLFDILDVARPGETLPARFTTALFIRKAPRQYREIPPGPKRREFIKAFVDVRTVKILEIGACASPTFKTPEVDIMFMDRLSTQELQKTVRLRNPRNAENIPQVNYVTTKKNFAKDIEQKFDLVIANHVVEHIPDLISWLRNISSILNSKGYLFLAVPHKEYTFDKERNLTALSEIIHNYEQDLEDPTRQQIFDFLFHKRPIKAVDVWNGNYERLLNQKKFETAKDTLTFVDAQLDNKKHVDAHCCVYTYQSFVSICNELARSEYIDLNLISSKDVEPPYNEFFILFEKGR